MVFKVFQCLAPRCESWIVVEVADIGPDFRILCPTCGHTLSDGEATRFYSYDLMVGDQVEESGNFEVDHGEYVRGAPDYKFCIICYTLKPLGAFGRHSSRQQSGRQGECTSCKTTYNSIKNKTRIPDQHREAGQRRRLLGLVGADTASVDREAIQLRFRRRCFACGTTVDEHNEALDHTLPVRLLWPLETQTATLLCRTCNGQKGALWPSEFYDEDHLRRLAVLTGYPYQLLAGEPTLNQDALAIVQEDPDAFLAALIDRPQVIRALRQLVQEMEGIDILKGATAIPPYLD